MFAQLAQRQSMPRGTHLSPRDEAGYQHWKATLPKRLQYEGDYDLRGFYKKNPQFSVDVPGQHMTDEFKLPNHRTFSDESKFYNPGTMRFGGHWTGDVYNPNSLQYKQRVDEGQPTPESPVPTRAAPSDLFSMVPTTAQPMGPPTPSFRDPQQAGPAPPTGPLSQMFGSPTVRGNIDVMHRPRVVNPDGSASSVRSMSFGEGGKEILVPTVSEDARIMSDDEAIDQYHRTGRHLGMFSTPDSATAYAGRLHNQQEALGDARSQSSGDMGPEARRALRLTTQARPVNPLAAMFGGQ